MLTDTYPDGIVPAITMTAKDLDNLKRRLRREIMGEFGRLGGRARKANLTKAQLSAIGKKAAKARWAHLRKRKNNAA